MADITQQKPRSGNLIDELGRVRNIVDLLGGGTPVSDKVLDPTQQAAKTGRVIGKDGRIYNLVDLIDGVIDLIRRLSIIHRDLGVTTTQLYDGATTNPILIDGVSTTAVEGDLVFYNGEDFVYNNEGVWLSVTSAFGALAYKSSASGSYTPAGTVSVTKTTDTITEVASVGSLPTFSYDSQTETVSFNAGSLPTTSNTDVVTDASATFSGTQATITVE